MAEKVPPSTSNMNSENHTVGLPTFNPPRRRNGGRKRRISENSTATNDERNMMMPRGQSRDRSFKENSPATASTRGGNQGRNNYRRRGRHRSTSTPHQPQSSQQHDQVSNAPTETPNETLPKSPVQSVRESGFSTEDTEPRPLEPRVSYAPPPSTVPHAANLNSPGFSVTSSIIRAQQFNDIQNQPSSSFDLSYLPYANSVLREFDFAQASNQTNDASNEFALAALDHELQQCRSDKEQVQYLKKLLHQSENRARNQLLRYHQIAVFSNLHSLDNETDQTRTQTLLSDYKRIDKRVEENQRLRELIHTCQNAIDKYHKKSGNPQKSKISPT